MFGADTAFDKRTLTDYFASRTYSLRIFLIANKFAKTVKGVPAVFAQAFQPVVVAA